MTGPKEIHIIAHQRQGFMKPMHIPPVSPARWNPSYNTTARTNGPNNLEPSVPVIRPAQIVNVKQSAVGPGVIYHTNDLERHSTLNYDGNTYLLASPEAMKAQQSPWLSSFNASDATTTSQMHP